MKSMKSLLGDNKSESLQPVERAIVPRVKLKPELKRIEKELKYKAEIKRLEDMTKKKKVKLPQRRYDAGKYNNILADWTPGNTSADSEVYGDIVTIRNRARELERNNPYVKKYLDMSVVNVVGSGFRLNMRVKNPDGSSDDMADRIIEESWKIWSRKRTASASGTMSLADLTRLYERGLDRDGEVIFRMLRGFDNRYGFSVQPLDVALLDERLNVTRPNGNKVIMGIEVDSFDRPVNYYFRNSFTNVIPTSFDPFTSNSWTVIPANEIIHAIDRERANQTRAVSPMSSIMDNLHQLDGYRNAELVASRIAACKMGFYVNNSGDDDTFSENEDNENFEGEWLDNAEPGIFHQLPSDWSVQTFDPSHPSTAFGDFVKSQMMSVASGLNVSYNMLASDSEGVNYSSLRGFVVADRDKWIIKQDELIQNFLVPIFENWLLMALLNETFPVNFKASNFNKFNKPIFMGRRWQWIDPLKDANANAVNVAHGWKTDSQVASEQGNDFEDNMAIQAKDNSTAEGVIAPLTERKVDMGSGTDFETRNEGDKNE